MSQIDVSAHATAVRVMIWLNTVHGIAFRDMRVDHLVLMPETDDDVRALSRSWERRLLVSRAARADPMGASFYVGSRVNDLLRTAGELRVYEKFVRWKPRREDSVLPSADSIHWRTGSDEYRELRRAVAAGEMSVIALVRRMPGVPR